MVNTSNVEAPRHASFSSLLLLSLFRPGYWAQHFVRVHRNGVQIVGREEQFETPA
jgi:hypothetical protein